MLTTEELSFQPTGAPEKMGAVFTCSQRPAS
jgi:hypothetical protein